MSRTFTIDKTTAATETPKVAISTFHQFRDELKATPQAQRYTTWIVVNMLNNSIIGNLQAHLRSARASTNAFAGLDQQTIDKLNEQIAAAQELVASDANREEQGFENKLSNLDIAEQAVNLRSYFAAQMTASAQTKRDLPQSIAESLAFRLSRTPSVNERQALAMHVATGVPLEDLRKAMLQAQVDERQQLLQMAGNINDLARELSWKTTVGDDEIEGVFDKLPVHTRYNLIGGVCKALKMAADSELRALVRFGRLEAVSNRVVINEVLEGYKAFFVDFLRENAEALMQYEESTGVTLKTLEEFTADKE